MRLHAAGLPEALIAIPYAKVRVMMTEAGIERPVPFQVVAASPLRRRGHGLNAANSAGQDSQS